MKIYINAMSESRKEIERSLSRITDVIVEHLIKLSVMPNHSARNHWKTEIAGHLSRIKRLDGSNKYPTAQDIYKWTYNKVRDNITDVTYMTEMLYDIATEYNVDIDADPEEVCVSADRVCHEYFTWLSKMLSTTGMVAKQRIYDKLDELV